MEYIKFKTSSDISNFTPETGCAVLFAEEASGNISLKVKLSDGNIVSILNQAAFVSAEEISTISVVSALPSTPAANTLYLVKESV